MFFRVYYHLVTTCLFIIILNTKLEFLFRLKINSLFFFSQGSTIYVNVGSSYSGLKIKERCNSLMQAALLWYFLAFALFISFVVHYGASQRQFK